MASDLTERLAAKLEDITEVPRTVASIVVGYLPLLLSEPELVASLPDTLKRELLAQLLDASEAGGMLNDFRDRMNSEFPPDTVLMNAGWHARGIWRWLRYRLVAGPLAEARALTPEGKDAT